MGCYQIQINRNGEVYLAHAVGSRSGGYNRTAPVKYIAKIGKGPSTQYFYTIQQLQAYKNGGRINAQQVQKLTPTRAPSSTSKSTTRSSGVNQTQFSGRKRKVVGKAEPVQKREKYEGPSANHKETNHQQNDRPQVSTYEHQRKKEYTEAKDAIKDYAWKKNLSKASAKQHKQASKEVNDIRKAKALLTLYGMATKDKSEKELAKEYKNALNYELTNTKRAKDATAKAHLNDRIDQAKAGAKATKEVSDVVVGDVKKKVKDKTTDAKNKLESTSDRMKEEYRKQEQKREEKKAKKISDAENKFKSADSNFNKAIDEYDKFEEKVKKDPNYRHIHADEAKRVTHEYNEALLAREQAQKELDKLKKK